MALDGSDQIKEIIRVWQGGYRAVLDFDTTRFYQFSVCLYRYPDTLFRIINAVDFSLRSDPGQLFDGATAAAAYVQDRIVFPD